MRCTSSTGVQVQIWARIGRGRQILRARIIAPEWARTCRTNRARRARGIHRRFRRISLRQFRADHQISMQGTHSQGAAVRGQQCKVVVDEHGRRTKRPASRTAPAASRTYPRTLRLTCTARDRGHHTGKKLTGPSRELTWAKCTICPLMIVCRTCMAHLRGCHNHRLANPRRFRESTSVRFTTCQLLTRIVAIVLEIVCPMT